ncbi:hypothetical protein Clacol_000310 [Clathrus columnatus]|uniref:Protein-S-isoprenylcysteine O-methyltransferase n=1 Tax=Clathrus columnatus TaxID=1419009 RepID=A0AAV4ZWD9_9AGAM|nr:hypothetical protein Clacol_000310 [Clathrus columnatus]
MTSINLNINTPVMLSAILKSSVLLLTAVFGMKTSIPPNRLTTKESPVATTLLEQIILLLQRYLIPTMIILPVIGELGSTIIGALALQRPQYLEVFTTICPSAPPSQLSHLSIWLLTSSALENLGSIIRLWCFRTLGRFFTLELVIRPDHKIVQSGPYAIVRHPSYTGALVRMIGKVLLVFSPQSFPVACGLMRSFNLILGIVIIWSLYTLFTFVVPFRRIPHEEAILHKHFGKEWENYERRVPYKLVDGVF